MKIDMNNFLECTGKSGNVCNQCARICAASRVDASPFSLSPAHHHRADKVWRSHRSNTGGFITQIRQPQHQATKWDRSSGMVCTAILLQTWAVLVEGMPQVWYTADRGQCGAAVSGVPEVVWSRRLYNMEYGTAWLLNQRYTRHYVRRVDNNTSAYIEIYLNPTRSGSDE